MNIYSKYFSDGTFGRNAAIFSSGFILAYLIGFAFTPIITRIYNPVDYGNFAIFNTLLSILFSVSTLNYTEALILPKKNEDFITLSRLSLLISFGFSFIFILILIFLKDFIINYFNIENEGYYFYLIPLISTLSIFQVLAENKSIREKTFSISSKAKIASVSAGKISVAAIGLVYGSNILGLVFGELVIRLVNFFNILKFNSIKFIKNLVMGIDRNAILRLAKEYSDYPRYVFPSSILLQLSVFAPIFIISKYYSLENLGHFSLAMSLLGIPIQVLGFSIGKVFLQKANELIKNGQKVLFATQIKKFFLILTVGSILFYLIPYFFGEPIFIFVAGKDWANAGKIASIMAFSLSFQLIGTIILPTFRVLKIERKRFLSECFGLSIIVSTIFFSIKLNLNIEFFLYFFSVAFFFKYLLSVIIIFKELRMLNSLPLLFVILIYVLLLTVVYSRLQSF